MIEGFPLSRKQIESIVESQDKRLSVWTGAVRSGKTVASILAFIGALTVAPKSGLILIVGRTLQTIERNIIIPMQDPELMGAIASHVEHTRGSSTAVILGRTVHLIGAADARAEGKLRGMSASLAMVDEATLIPEEFWTQLLARLSVPGARCLATTNPGSPAHWLKKKFLDRKADLDLGSWHFNINDNPSLEAEYIKALKSEFTGLFYKRFILGEWVAAEGAVFAFWNEDEYVVPWESLPPMQRLFGVGIDYGTTHATSAIVLGVGIDGVLYFIDEWRYEASDKTTALNDAKLSEAIRDWLAGDLMPHPSNLKPEWVVVDPAAASLKVMLRDYGMDNVIDANNDVLYGIRTLSSLYMQGKLKVSDRCQGLIQEMPGYAWDKKATEKGEDKPLKVADDSIDPSRYIVVTTETNWRPYVDLAA
ncbi:PBSX family phage terminase large subunit [Arthrobacter pityocampae]|uniref:PBSX family phage terminase large subunit n=1 Tax=Arthrobacter pityocampae TaxID=547334 RepID=UPI003736C3B8